MVELTRWSGFSVQKMTELLFDLVIITWGPFLETPDNFPDPLTEYFFELIYLSANGYYWRKLSDMLHEIVKIKI